MSYALVLSVTMWSQSRVRFTSYTEEGVAVSYYILDEYSNYCYVGDYNDDMMGMPQPAINRYTTGSLTIPETVLYNGHQYGVVQIDMEAFAGCTGLTSVTLPGSIAGSSSDAFYGCTGLESIKLPKKVEYKGDCWLEGYFTNTLPMIIANTQYHSIYYSKHLLITSIILSCCSGVILLSEGKQHPLSKMSAPTSLSPPAI